MLLAWVFTSMGVYWHGQIVIRVWSFLRRWQLWCYGFKSLGSTKIILTSSVFDKGFAGFTKNIRDWRERLQGTKWICLDQGEKTVLKDSRKKDKKGLYPFYQRADDRSHRSQGHCWVLDKGRYGSDSYISYNQGIKKR